MAKQWFIWLGGTDEYTVCDANSEIDLSALPAPLPTVNETNWLKVAIIGLDAQKSPWDDEAIAQAQEYSLLVEPVEFPGEMDILDKIDTVFRKRFIYLGFEGAGQAAETKYPNDNLFMISDPALKAIAITDEKSHSVEHDHEGAIKTKTYQIRKRLPIL